MVEVLAHRLAVALTDSATVCGALSSSSLGACVVACDENTGALGAAHTSGGLDHPISSTLSSAFENSLLVWECTHSCDLASGAKGAASVATTDSIPPHKCWRERALAGKAATGVALTVSGRGCEGVE